MRRVTSRQRLFSWDQFDATAPDYSSDESVGNGYSNGYGNRNSNSNSNSSVYSRDDEYSSSSHNNNNNNHHDHDSDDYMSCLSLSRHTDASSRWGHGGSGGGIMTNHNNTHCYSRSSSQLSLKNFSAHAYLDEDEDDDHHDDDEEGAIVVLVEEDDDDEVLKKDGARAGIFAAAAAAIPAAGVDLSKDSEDNHNHTLTPNRKKMHELETRVVSPAPGTMPPRRMSSMSLSSMGGPTWEEELVGVLTAAVTPRNYNNDKKRNLDDMKKSSGLESESASVSVLESASFSKASLCFPNLENVAVADADADSGADCASLHVSGPGTKLNINVLVDMQQDVQIHVFGFLNLGDLHALSLTCSRMYHLLAYGTYPDGFAKQENDDLVQNATNVSKEGNDKDKGNVVSESVSGIRNVLWWNMMCRQWPDLGLVPTDRYGLETTCSTQGDDSSSLLLSWDHSLKEQRTPGNVRFVNLHSSDGHGHGHGIHYMATLSQSQLSPTCIANKYFQERPPPVNLIPLPLEQQDTGNTHAVASTSRPPLFRSFVHDIQGQWVDVVQYVGDVGTGDRSICSNHPFPKPNGTSQHRKLHSTMPTHANPSFHGGVFPGTSPIARLHGLPLHIHNLIQEQRELANRQRNGMNFFGRLRGCHMYHQSVGAVIKSRHCHGKPKEDGVKAVPKPFVSPYVSSSIIGMCVEIDVTPRMIAYFEVSILSKDDVKSLEKQDEPVSTLVRPFRMEPLLHPRTARNANEVHSACVAVGLSTQGFNDSSRMPGWDSSSYGYHGDDGGIFHSHGEMIRVYGPTYNVGDTVGCGVNYMNGGIFYTLNGNFLGYAWVKEKIVLEGKLDLFPTVGLDSADPIACNFGNRRPFVFNFAGFVANDGNMPIGTVNNA